jgi:hypothetical protein
MCLTMLDRLYELYLPMHDLCNKYNIMFGETFNEMTSARKQNGM